MADKGDIPIKIENLDNLFCEACQFFKKNGVETLLEEEEELNDKIEIAVRGIRIQVKDPDERMVLGEDQSDENWTSCAIDRRSYTGYCFIYVGGPVSWESRKQRTVALSTTEAEYMALTLAAKEAIHLKQLTRDMGIPHEKIIIYNDNQAAQKLYVNPVVSSSSKHISIKEQFIRDVIQEGTIEVAYRGSSDMEADTNQAVERNFAY
ncbi:hypothetical protein Trydic_g5509 [Trypoxylus dichotomus]